MKPSELCPDEYVKAVLLCAFFVGVLNTAAGLMNLGFLVNFLAHPVVAVTFTIAHKHIAFSMNIIQGISFNLFLFYMNFCGPNARMVPYPTM